MKFRNIFKLTVLALTLVSALVLVFGATSEDRSRASYTAGIQVGKD